MTPAATTHLGAGPRAGGLRRVGLPQALFTQPAGTGGPTR